MIIYRILNKINNKSYIGQSVLTFNKRYRGGETNQKSKQQ
jgi:hypothetical protein